MLALVGSRVCYRTIGSGVFHCERCGGDRPYRHRLGRRWARLAGIRLARLGGTGEHLRCAVCRTWYRVELLAVPTMEQMLVALLAGTKAAVLAMLRAGGTASPAARRRAVQMIRAAGAPDYHDDRLLAALAGTASVPGTHGSERAAAADDRPEVGLRPAVEAFAIQLEIPAREWFLAKIVEIGLADGPLSTAEREVAGTVARYLGMTAAHGRDVIMLAEEAAQAW
jgi:tellurite resistance protein